MVAIGYDCLSGIYLGVEIFRVAGLVFPIPEVFPIPRREGDIRLLRLGDVIDFTVNRNGTACITSPEPRIGCERRG